jgi:hypothetical protein
MKNVTLQELQLADDMVLAAEREEILQQIISKITAECKHGNKY